MRINRALVTIATIASVALSGCSVSVGGGKSVDVEELEENLKAQLAAQVGTVPKDIECPSDIEAEAGQRLRCTLVTPSGSKFGMTVTIKGVTGDQVSFSYKVDQTPRSTTGGSGS